MYCLNQETKEHIIDATKNLHIVKDKREQLTEFINSLDACSVDDIQLGKKKKRPLSSYNVFLGQCMGKSKLSMKECIPKWRIIKECIKNNGSLESCKAEQGY